MVIIKSNNTPDYVARISDIGKRIKSERTRAHMTQGQLADKVSALLQTETVGQPAISAWEKGAAIPPLNKLVCLSVIFGCDVAFLLGDIPDRTRDATDVNAITGLSSAAVAELKAVRRSPKLLAAYDFMLTESNFLRSVAKYLTCRGQTNSGKVAFATILEQLPLLKQQYNKGGDDGAIVETDGNQER